MALPARFELAAYRLGGGRSIRTELWEQLENYIIVGTKETEKVCLRCFFHRNPNEKHRFQSISLPWKEKMTLFFAVQWKKKDEKEKPKMRVNRLLCIGAVAILSLVPGPRMEREAKYEIQAAGPTVCMNGNLALSGSTVHNNLPPGFYGNHPDQGVLEIGGTAGNPLGEEIPELSLVGDDRQMLTIRFEESITQLKDAAFLGRVGYCIAMRTDEGLKEEEVFSSDLRLDDFFQKLSNGDYKCPERGREFNSFMKFDAEENAFSLTFDYRKEWKLVSLRFYYSDVPASLSNVSLYANVYPQSEIFSAVYDGVSCTGNYTRNVGKNPVYEMDSQFGTVYSKDFLVHSFLARDENLKEAIHPEIEDPDDYFGKGDKADVGETFVVYLRASDPSGNVSKVTLKMNIVDSRGPNIVVKSPESIEVSYASDFSSMEFIDSHFVIRDNYDSMPDCQILLEDGSPIPKAEIGVFQAMIVATDSFGNETAKHFELDLIDDVPPVIDVQGEELILRQDLTYSREKLLSLFTAYDEIDGDLDVVVTEDTYLGHEKEIGEYVFSVKATDSAGNVATRKLAIRVEDSEGPTFYVRESFLTVIEGEVPSLEDVVKALIRQNVLPNKVYSEMRIIEGEELDDSLPLGKHAMTLEVVDEDGFKEYVALTVEVVRKDSIEDPITHTMTFWERFCQFWIDLWNKIVAFFTGGN